MIVQDLLRKAILNRQVEIICEKKESWKEEYDKEKIRKVQHDFLETLLSLKPNENKEGNIIVMEKYWDTDCYNDDKIYSYISPEMYIKKDIKKYLKKIKNLECPIKEYNENASSGELKELLKKFPDRPVAYAYYFSEWEDILGWDVYEGNLDEFDLQDCIYGLLFELSFNGTTKEMQDERRKELDNSIKESEEIHNLPEEEQKKRLKSLDDLKEELSWEEPSEEEFEMQMQKMYLCSLKCCIWLFNNFKDMIEKGGIEISPMDFKFYKDGDSFIWENHDLKLVFSNSSFQAHDDFGYTKSIKDIMYLYYNVAIYKDKISYDFDDEECHSWEKLTEQSVYDFPTIEQLQFILNKMLNEEIKEEDCRKITYYMPSKEGYIPSGSVGYEFTMESEGFVTEDYYKITRVLKKDKEGKIEDIDYSLFVGTNFGSNPTASVGVNYTKLTEKDLKALYKCVNRFIENAIEEHNKHLFETHKEAIESFSLRSGMLFEINNDKILNIYEVGQICDIYMADNDITNKDMHSIEYHNVKIEEIKNDSIIVSGGYKQKEYEIENYEGKEEIPFSRMLDVFSYISENVNTEHRLKFSEEEIISDFYSILDDEAKKEFANKDIDFLFRKWVDAICDRSWMCREEHNFKEYVKDEGNHENVLFIIKNIVHKLKEESQRELGIFPEIEK